MVTCSVGSTWETLLLPQQQQVPGSSRWTWQGVEAAWLLHREGTPCRLASWSSGMGCWQATIPRRVSGVPGGRAIILLPCPQERTKEAQQSPGGGLQGLQCKPDIGQWQMSARGRR